MKLNWNTKRKMLYAFVVSSFIISSVLYIYRDTFFPAPTCFDNKQNGYESGIDCGGVCDLRCKDEVTPLSVIWTRFILVGPNTYDLIAMVSNKNINNAPKEISYTFFIYDKDGGNISFVDGKTIVPVDTDFPVIKQNIHINKIPSALVLKVNAGPSYKVSEKPTSPTVTVSNISYEKGDTTRVYANISNTKFTRLLDLPVRVILYGNDNNIFAVGETVIPLLDKQETKTVTFTWNFPLSQTPKVIRVYPIFDPFIPSQ